MPVVWRSAYGRSGGKPRGRGPTPGSGAAICSYLSTTAETLVGTFNGTSAPANMLDGTYEHKSTGRLKFIPASAPSMESITRLVTDLARRINSFLTKKGYLEEVDVMPVLGNTEELFEAGHDELHLPAQAASVAHRIAFGSNTGKPVRRLRLGNRLWPSEGDGTITSSSCVSAGGYSVHAATAIKPHERERLELDIDVETYLRGDR